MTERRCKATTKRGNPCKAIPRGDTGLCNAHSPREVQESAGFGGSQPGAGRPKLPKPTELARQLVEQHAARLLRPHFRALGLDLHDDGTVTPLEGGGAIVVHNGQATDIEDLGAQIAAAERLLDRVYGKPRQALEHTGAEGGPITVTDLSWLKES